MNYAEFKAEQARVKAEFNRRNDELTNKIADIRKRWDRMRDDHNSVTESIRMGAQKEQEKIQNQITALKLGLDNLNTRRKMQLQAENSRYSSQNKTIEREYNTACRELAMVRAEYNADIQALANDEKGGEQ